MSTLSIAVPLLDLKPQYLALKPELDAAVADVIASQYFILGPTVEKFENACAEYCNTAHAIGVSSGTDALIVAMMAMGIGEGDEVITSPYTFFGTVGSIVRLGATPVFVDIEPGTFNIDVAKIEAVITDKTRAIAPVHLFGQMADMRAINRLAREHDLLVIEDAAQAIGAKQHGHPACSFGHMGCLSFFPTKNLGGFGDGGMVVCDDAEYANISPIAQPRHGAEILPFPHRRQLPPRCPASRGARRQTQAPQQLARAAPRKCRALSQTQLENAGISRSVDLLDSGDLQNGIILPTEKDGNYHIYNQFVIYSDQRDALIDHLRANNVGCEIYYPLALHEQECFRLLGYKQGDFPNSERAAAMSLALPIFPDLAPEQITRVVEVITDFFA